MNIIEKIKWFIGVRREKIIYQIYKLRYRDKDTK
jgi:hypothetical protein